MTQLRPGHVISGDVNGAPLRETRMFKTWTILAPFLCCLVLQTNAQFQNVIYGLAEDCQKPGPQPLGMQSGHIKADQLWASTSVPERGPNDGRVYGPAAWQAAMNDINQFFAIDLLERKTLTAVSTQGQRGSNRFVRQYYIQYSTDNITWIPVTDDTTGDPELFFGNSDDNGVVINPFKTPIVAQFIRFNPQRWSVYIAMRVELYGCGFTSDIATFGGNEAIVYDLSQPNWEIKSRLDSLYMRFRTTEPDGLLLFAEDNQGDYIIVELVRGHLRFSIDLGTIATQTGATSVETGSLLDDNQWHDVEILRDRKDITVTVDRLTQTQHANGLFDRLDLDKKIYLGAAPDYRKRGMTVRRGFKGCMENVVFNAMHLIRDAKAQVARHDTMGSIAFSCRRAITETVTFPSTMSHLKIPTSTGALNTYSAKFEFRTYNEEGMMLYQELQGGHVMLKIIKPGFLQYQIKGRSSLDGSTIPIVEETIENIDPKSTDKAFSDGLWHAVDLSIGTNKINLTVDGYSWVAKRILQIETSSTNILIGGGRNDQHGFIGCMRNLAIGGNPFSVNALPVGTNIGAANGTCGMRDRCLPNPCEHDGVCTQTWDSFNCTCNGTGYTGAVCHTSAHPVSCDEVKQLDRTYKLTEKETMIDLDGSGPLKPFKVVCKFTQTGENETWVGHQNGQETTVNGFQQPGSYRQAITYDANKHQLDELIRRSDTCRQFIQYKCRQSRLMTNPGIEEGPRSYGWWTGRTYQRMYYWGGAAPDTESCQCGITGQCEDKTRLCNCDSSKLDWTADEGYLSYKEHLPVMELFFGDTGTLTDTKEGKYTLGQLICVNDHFFKNTVTFRKMDAALEFDTLKASESWDIRFQFKTTATTGIFIKNTGASDFIEVRLITANTIYFRFDVGTGIQTLAKITSFPLNNDEWHTVHVERNRKEATLKVDTQSEVEIPEPQNLGFRPLALNSRLFVGAGVDYQDGFVGCMRALQVNGVNYDMVKKVQEDQYKYGLEIGCVGKCMSNPCLHNGVCKEFYDRYECECTYTTYRGYICGREVGTNFLRNMMLLYTFDSTFGSVSTDEETIQIGFSTQLKQGILMQIQNADNSEYLTVEINNNGGIKVSIQVGFGLEELSTAPGLGVLFDNKQQHVARIWRTNNGRVLHVQVDEYPEVTKTFNLPPNSDTKLDAPKYMYIGKNTSTPVGEGFEGCIYHMQFDTIYPIKEAFRDPRPNWIQLFPKASDFNESMCGFEEVLDEDQPEELRPDRGVKREFIPSQYLESNQAQSAVIGGVLAIVFVILILVAFLVYRYWRREKGEYKTYEAKGAEESNQADEAIARGATRQPEVSTKKEYYI
ncbi:neurexin-4 [Lingula anatina]|uniref:Neurexin-4 n=1 Tax=Lingula anatina TaxID=7574 RepID=A0A1S3HQD8_LINAN|nr:neurexin-4 [Lingula anatina]|eukprot:XP_013388250.1 neurexin-4 [Lingula anatina]